MNLREFPGLIAKGFCMGAADLVPGVSGGTMAFILGIYERLLNAIKSFDRSWIMAMGRLELKAAATRPDFPFLIPLLLGIVLALLFFTRVVSLPELLRTQPEAIYGLFFGLILASIVVLLREVGRLSALDMVVLALGILVGLVIVNLVPVETPDAAWFVFVSGAIAICAMILPGVSGSFLLLILRKYAYVVSALGELNFAVLIPFALGCVTGLALFSRLLVWLLQRFYRRTLLVIKGVLIASLWVIWPFQDRTFIELAGKQKLVSSRPVWPATLDEAAGISLVLMVVGFLVVLGVHHLSKRRMRSHS